MNTLYRNEPFKWLSMRHTDSDSIQLQYYWTTEANQLSADSQPLAHKVWQSSRRSIVSLSKLRFETAKSRVIKLITLADRHRKPFNTSES